MYNRHLPQTLALSITLGMQCLQNKFGIETRQKNML